MDYDLWARIAEIVRNGQLDAAIESLEQGLGKCEGQRFKCLLDCDFTNDPAEIADHIDLFVTFCEGSFPVEAIYFEMNCFYINVNLWYFDSFGYNRYVETQHDLEWLPYWNSARVPPVELRGLEAAQRDYDWYSNQHGHEDAAANMAENYAALLVMCKFARLIGKSVAESHLIKRLPILASAHDFDIIPKFWTKGWVQ